MDEVFDLRIEPMVHIAGLDITIGRFQRQRCAWCGNILIDYDLSMVAVALMPGETTGKPPSGWEVGALVEVSNGGGYSSVVSHEDGDRLPKNACINFEKPLSEDN